MNPGKRGINTAGAETHSLTLSFPAFPLRHYSVIYHEINSAQMINVSVLTQAHVINYYYNISMLKITS